MIEKFDTKIVSLFQSAYDYFMVRGFRTHIFVQQLCILTSVLVTVSWTSLVTLDFIFEHAKGHYIECSIWDFLLLLMDVCLILNFIIKGKQIVDSVERGLPINLDADDRSHIMRTILLVLFIYGTFTGWNIDHGSDVFMKLQQTQHLVNHIFMFLMLFLWYTFSVTFRPPTKTLKKESFAFQS